MTKAEVGKPGSSQRRRRGRRRRARAQTDVEAKPQGAKAGTNATGKTGAEGRARRSANPGRASDGAAREPDRAAETNRPTRRRRRRSRKLSSPE
jgi:hypothetical protein